MKAPTRKRQKKRFDHGEPIAGIDTRPLAFVMVFLVIVISIGRFDPFGTVPSVDLPFAVTKPVQGLDERFVVTITTTRTAHLKSQEGRLVSLFIADRDEYLGECRAHLSDGTAVTGYELYDYAFGLLDSPLRSDPPLTIVDSEPHSGERIRSFYIRADRSVPWRCIGGAISNLENAGFSEVSLLTTPFV